MALPGTRNGQRLAIAKRVESAVHDTLTRELFGDDEDQAPAEGGLLRAAADLIKDRVLSVPLDQRDAAASTLTAAGWSSPLLTRVPAKTTLADIAGLRGNSAVSGTLPENVQARINRRQRPARAMLDALTDPLDLGAQPWIVTPAPPVAGGTQPTGEHSEFPTRKLTASSGAYQQPVPRGATYDISWQVMTYAGDSILAMIGEDALLTIAVWLRDQLISAAGAAVATLPAALAAIEATGWNPDTILLPLSRVDRLGALADLPPDATTGLTIVAGAPTGDRVLVLSRAGLDARITDQLEARIAEPSIAGFEVWAGAWTTFAAAAGSVKQVTA